MTQVVGPCWSRERLGRSTALFCLVNSTSRRSGRRDSAGAPDPRHVPVGKVRVRSSA